MKRLIGWLRGPAPTWECGHQRVDTLWGALKWRLAGLVPGLDATVDTAPAACGLERWAGGHFVCLFWLRRPNGGE